MDKEIVERVRKSLTAIADTLQELNDYLTELRQRTDEEIASLARRTLAAQAAARVQPAPVPGEPIKQETVPVYDPRFPYVAGRQPRRDGDSFARVAPKQGADSHDDDPARSVRPPGQR